MNRGTFYAHYKDPHDLLQKMEDELFHKIVKYIDETPVNEYSDSLLLNVLELISENRALCKILFCRQRDNKLLDKLIVIASKADLEQISEEFSKSYSHYYMRYIVCGCIAIVQTWLENDLPESPSEIVKIINSVNTINYNDITQD